RSIDFRTRVEPLGHPVLADSSQIHQIVMNLCTNAAHAMREEGGVLDVSLAEIVVDEHSEKAGLELTTGSWARISVSDTGHGIDVATMEHIFEPFFTTKQDDGGTGLGLSTVHGIVKQHGGTITVYSEPGRGTIFHVYLPLARDADAESYQAPGVIASGNGQRILVVDDEAPVAQMLSQMLEKLRYSVTVCVNGIDALDKFRADPDQYDLVLTDHAMPRMTGQQLVKEVKRIRPHLPILMATGFDAKIDAAELGISGVLLKPVLFERLAFAVKSALESQIENAAPSAPDLCEKGG
ncbi:MAG: response regulator, partial [Candidatus Hydrogenedentes bacterium]|nr:response regulator [Candidatus Hydrogenedentota bacterium]